MFGRLTVLIAFTRLHPGRNTLHTRRSRNYTTNCNTQSSAPEDGQNNCPKHVQLTEIINKPLLLHLFGCLYYLYQWCIVKQISDYEIYLLIKYIKSVLWRVVKRLSHIENARCLKVNAFQMMATGLSNNTTCRSTTKVVTNTTQHHVYYSLIRSKERLNRLKASTNNSRSSC